MTSTMTQEATTTDNMDENAETPSQNPATELIPETSSVEPEQVILTSEPIPISYDPGTSQSIQQMSNMDTFECCNCQRQLKTAIVLWVVFGLVGGHHLYLRRYGHCVLYVALVWVAAQFPQAGAPIYFTNWAPLLIFWFLDACRLERLVDLANASSEERHVTWFLWDVYQFWFPPLGIGGFYYLYMKDYWKFVTHLFSLGGWIVGWLMDGILIWKVHYPNIVENSQRELARRNEHVERSQQVYGVEHNPDVLQSEDDTKIEAKIESDETDAESLDNPDKTWGQLVMCWIPFNGMLGFHHFYVGDTMLGIVYMFSFGLFGLGWLVDVFRLTFMWERHERLVYLETVENANGSPNDSQDHGQNSNDLSVMISRFVNKHMRSVPKNKWDGCLAWIGSLGFLGFHHLYFGNFWMFLGHILTFGGCGLFWFIDLFRMPFYVERSNERKMLSCFDIEVNVYTAYLFWMPMMGFIGMYYLYLGRYKDFFIRFFTLNFLLVGWIIDLFRLPDMVKEVNERNAQRIDMRNRLI